MILTSERLMTKTCYNLLSYLQLISESFNPDINIKQKKSDRAMKGALVYLTGFGRLPIELCNSNYLITARILQEMTEVKTSCNNPV